MPRGERQNPAWGMNGIGQMLEKNHMDQPYQILENLKVSYNYFKIKLTAPGSPVPKPGQFYQIRCSTTTDPLLRRPFSVHRFVQSGNMAHLEILYRVAGKGTEWLSNKKNHEFLDILGPFGNGFILDEGNMPLVIVSRGIGIAPLYALGEEVRERDKKREIFILMGARLKERVFYEFECKSLGKVFIYTDDGSIGFHGRAPDLLLHLLQEKKLPEKFALYACGPAKMLKDLAELSVRFSFRGQVAMEDRMGCGFGACFSCVCPLRVSEIVINEQWVKPALQWSEDGTQVYSLVCKDGPVYDLNEVDWNEWTA